LEKLVALNENMLPSIQHSQVNLYTSILALIETFLNKFPSDLLEILIETAFN
jgi:hypothetical protein